ncbi:ANTAR domain-containing protein [Isoptericola sp. S6320L]|uniref:ANTAR domain-containing protein n=1 Tax=Isoptericola sp. S6320L TaxID=2926411 RepID=UPI001FF1D61D|nr:ANTAR domain-containing protein [Isoptericola sp. S6320L]MCK0116717.1 ANTAR domain-containing protein [Isoptericola sp. S6320L]
MVDPNLLSRLVGMLTTLEREIPLAEGVCRACARAFGARGGALTFAPMTLEQMTVTTGDETTQRMEDLQEVLGEGPGLLAFTQERAVATVVGSQASSIEFPDFPAFASGAATSGLSAAVVAAPLRLERRPLGVLTLYQEADQVPLRPDAAQQLADTASTILLSSSTPVEQWWPDDGRRHRAIGMVMAQLGATAGDALAVLRARALAGSTTLRSVIDDVLHRRTDFGSDDDS